MDARIIVSSRGQIVIPKYMRETLGLHYGSELILSLREDKVLEVHSMQKNICDFFGRGKSRASIMSLADIDTAIAQAVTNQKQDT
jgi:AbrB family looped-hinge helix DNA binding protein